MSENNEQNAADLIGDIGFSEPIPAQESQFVIPNSMKPKEVVHENLIEDIGWLNIPLENLPSKGRFYPDGTTIRVRPASAAEIRHWSTIDENDLKSADDALNKVAERCIKISIPGVISTFKDVKDIDRFYLIFGAREITFKKGENAINVNFECKKCGKKEVKTITKEMISFYNGDNDVLEKYYDNSTKSYLLKLTNGEIFNLYVPSIGVSTFIFNTAKDLYAKGGNIDEAFLKWAPFLVKDWRILNEAYYTKLLQDSFLFSFDKIGVLDYFVTQVQKSIDPKLRSNCSACSHEVTAPLDFPGGLKSLFLISDISSKLL